MDLRLPVETGKYFRLPLQKDPFSTVLYVDLCKNFSFFYGKPDPAARFCILDCIVQKIKDRLLRPLGIMGQEKGALCLRQDPDLLG